MIRELKRIRERPIRLDQGICGNLRTLVGDEKWKETSLHLRSLMDEWPETSGDRFYPVEGSGAKYLSSARHRTLWDNPRRIALLDWLIGEYELASDGNFSAVFHEGKTFLVDHESGQKVEVVEGRAQIRECVLIVDEGYVFLRRMKNG